MLLEPVPSERMASGHRTTITLTHTLSPILVWCHKPFCPCRPLLHARSVSPSPHSKYPLTPCPLCEPLPSLQIPLDSMSPMFMFHTAIPFPFSLLPFPSSPSLISLPSLSPPPSPLFPLLSLSPPPSPPSPLLPLLSPPGEHE